MTITASYVDGFNLYHSIDALGKEHLKWLNLNNLSRLYLRPGDNLAGVVYFTAHMVWDQTKLKRHKEYIKALETTGVETIISRFQRSDKICATYSRKCKFQEEKQTDVAISSRILCDVLKRGIERVIILTADSDQIPTVAALRALAPAVHISILAPPGRAKIARELCALGHDYREISQGAIEKCLFPRNVRDARGRVAARCPAKYSDDLQIT